MHRQISSNTKTPRNDRSKTAHLRLAVIFALAMVLVACSSTTDIESANPDESTSASEGSSADASSGDTSTTAGSISTAEVFADLAPGSLADCSDGPTRIEVPLAANPGDAYPLLISDAPLRGCFVTSTLACDTIGLVIGRAELTDTFPQGEESATYSGGQKAPAGTLFLVFDASMTNLADGPEASSGGCEMMAEVPNALYWETVVGLPADANEIVGAVAANRIAVRLEDNETWQGKAVLPVAADATSVEIQTGFGTDASFTHVYELPPAP